MVRTRRITPVIIAYEAIIKANPTPDQISIFLNFVISSSFPWATMSITPAYTKAPKLTVPTSRKNPGGAAL